MQVAERERQRSDQLHQSAAFRTAQVVIARWFRTTVVFNGSTNSPDQGCGWRWWWTWILSDLKTLLETGRVRCGPSLRPPNHAAKNYKLVAKLRPRRLNRIAHELSGIGFSESAAEQVLVEIEGEGEPGAQPYAPTEVHDTAQICVTREK